MMITKVVTLKASNASATYETKRKLKTDSRSLELYRSTAEIDIGWLIDATTVAI